MLRLLFLLLGDGVVQRRWRLVVGVGGLWGGLGLFILLDALDDVSLIPIHHLGYFVLAEGVLTLIAAFAGVAQRRRLRMIKGGGLVVIGLLTVRTPWHSDVLLAVMIGASFAADGVFRIAAARVVRFPHWRASLWRGVIELVIAIATLQPLPTWYVGTIGANVGLLMILSGSGIVQFGLALRAHPAGAPLSMLLGQHAPWHQTGETAAPAAFVARAATAELVVRVWTPVGALGAGKRQRRMLIDRYIAAVDEAGTISTGHAALEVSPDLYISHYPATEIDRSPSDFTRALRATRENDVPGRFQPSYAEEASGWCEATEQVRFGRFDAARLRAFWSAYRADTTYNLTHRNCSSAVAHALDAALEGMIGSHPHPLPALMIALARPEFWMAGMLRNQAEAMAWTPGLVLDYARALRAAIAPLDRFSEPPPQ